MTADFFEVCHYTDVCYDGRLYFFHPEVAKAEDVEPSVNGVDFIFLDSEFDPVERAQKDQERENQLGHPVFHLPFASRLKGSLVRSLDKVWRE